MKHGCGTGAWRLLFGALLLLATIPAFDRAHAGSLTLDALTQEQQDRVWARLDQLAFFESGAKVCGRPTRLETRLREAAAECLSPATMDAIASTFRRKMNDATPTFDKAAYCGNPKIPAILTSFHASTDELVSKVASMCKACLASGLCR